MPRRSSRTSRQPSRLGYLDSTMADMKEGKGTSLEPTELELPPSPSSSSTSSLSVSSCSKSSSVRKLKAEANLEMARRMQKIEEEEADRRLERQKRILRLELEAKHAEIDDAASARSGRSSRRSSSTSSHSRKRLRPLLDSTSLMRLRTPPVSDPTANRTVQWVALQQPAATSASPTVQPPTAFELEVQPPQPLAKELHVQALEEQVRELQGAVTKLDMRQQHSQPLETGHHGFEKMLIRQTVGRDLPTFTGCPEEWPVFFATYSRTTEECGFTDSENIIRLQRCLRGAAKIAVGPLLALPENLQGVMAVLESRFGRPDNIIASLVAKAKAVPPLKTGDLEGMIAFATTVKTLVMTMQNLRSEGHMYNPQLRQELVNRLPTTLKLRWGEAIVRRGYQDISLHIFGDWLAERAEAAACVTTPSIEGKTRGEPMYTTREAPPAAIINMCPVCQFGTHTLEMCDEFNKLKVRARWEVARNEGRCFSCLGIGHAAKTCGKKQKCQEPGCEHFHHPLLHSAKKPNTSIPETCGHTGIVGGARVLLRVLPVTVHGPTASVNTFALLDEASTVTLMDCELAEEIGVVGAREPLRMSWTNSAVHTDNDSRRVTVTLSGPGGEQHQLVGARTVADLQLHSQSLDMPKLTNKWPHLAGDKVKAYEYAQPRLLIGQDNSQLTVAREVIEGPPNSPLLTRSLLGWVVHGCTETWSHRSQIEPEVTCHIRQPDDSLHQLVRESFTTENIGVKSSTTSGKSAAICRAEKIMDTTTTRVGERFETDLLWRRWVKEYLPTLTRRTKWFKQQLSLNVGDVVVIADPNVARGMWPRGKIEAVHPGKDGVVRVADVRTKSAVYRRPVVKLAKLDVLR